MALRCLAAVWSLPLLILLIGVGRVFGGSGTYTYSEGSWQAPLQVYEYKAYRSVRILQYSVPLQTTHATWNYNGLQSSPECEERTIIIALQYGGLPLITPLNETFPPNFNTHRTELRYISLRTKDQAIIFQRLDPLPGSWFAAVFLGDHVDKKIAQKGFGPSCQYFLRSTQLAEALETVPKLVPRILIPLNIIQQDNVHYRFHTTEQTWQYEITISNCSFTPLVHVSSNGTENVTYRYPDCPLLLASRSMALARFNAQSNTVNCSEAEGGVCKLTVSAPVANAWNYIFMDSIAPGNIFFKIYIDIKECVRYQRETAKHGDSTADEIKSPLSNTTSNGTETANITVADEEPNIISFPVPPSSSSSHLTITVFNTSFMVPGATKQSSNTSKPAQNKFPDNPDSVSLGLGSHVPLNDTLSDLNLEGLDTCTRIPQLGRYSRGTFDVWYSLRIGTYLFPNQLRVPEEHPLVLAFDVKPMIDTGGTLKFAMEMPKYKLTNTTVGQVSIVSCIQGLRIPLDNDGIACHPDNKLIVNTSSDASLSASVYFPYPEPGTWYITLQSRCYTQDNGTEEVVPCLDRQAVFRFLIAIAPCVDHVCGDYGFCREYFSGVLHFSACACTANWRGYGCTDGSVGESDALQLAATLILTLSNLAFIPAIILALYRHFFVEALVYTYTMFFSTFYHACDGDSRHVWCMMPYNVLAHCDFFGAILSFWVTLVAMAKLPERVRSFLLVFGALALAVGVQWDRHSLWTFLVPAATALVIMVVCWCRQCYGRRRCYPPVRRWVLFILPGALIALTGLITFAFFETDRNYKYTHSVWHACIALCIVFILPPRQPNPKDVDVESLHGLEDSSCCFTASCCQPATQTDGVHLVAFNGVHHGDGGNGRLSMDNPAYVLPIPNGDLPNGPN